MVKTRRRKTVKNRTMKKQIKNRQLRKRRTKKRGGTSVRRYLNKVEKNAADDMYKKIDEIFKIILKQYDCEKEKEEIEENKDMKEEIKKNEIYCINKDIKKNNIDFEKMEDIERLYTKEKISIDRFIDYFLENIDKNNKDNPDKRINYLFIFLIILYRNPKIEENNPKKLKIIIECVGYMFEKNQRLNKLRKLADILLGFSTKDLMDKLAEKIYEITQKYQSYDQKTDTDFSSLRLFLETEINYLDRLFKIKEKGEYIFPGIKIKEKDKYSFNIGESSNTSPYVAFNPRDKKDRKRLQMKVYNSFTEELFNTLKITAS